MGDRHPAARARTRRRHHTVFVHPAMSRIQIMPYLPGVVGIAGIVRVRTPGLLEKLVIDEACHPGLGRLSFLLQRQSLEAPVAP